MKWSVSLWRGAIVILTLSVLIMALFGCTGPMGPQGPAGLPGPQGPQGLSANTSGPYPSIVIRPNIVDSTMEELQVSGAGFTPGSSLSVGILGLDAYSDIEGAKGLWVAALKVNEYGAFTVTVDLAGSIFSLVSRNVMTEEELLGTYALVAENELGEKAITAITVVSPPLKEE